MIIRHKQSLDIIDLNSTKRKVKRGKVEFMWGPLHVRSKPQTGVVQFISEVFLSHKRRKLSSSVIKVFLAASAHLAHRRMIGIVSYERIGSPHILLTEPLALPQCRQTQSFARKRKYLASVRGQNTTKAIPGDLPLSLFLLQDKQFLIPLIALHPICLYHHSAVGRGPCNCIGIADDIDLVDRKGHTESNERECFVVCFADCGTA